jgi:hypothetical protein
MTRSSSNEAKPSSASKRTGRPPQTPTGGIEREKWGAMIRSDLLLELRKLALDRRVSPYAVLDDAVEAYLQKTAATR